MKRWIAVAMGLALVLPEMAMAGYADVVAADRPVGYWRFEESTGETAAAAAGAAQGTYRNVAMGQASAAPALGKGVALGVGAGGPGGVSIANAPLPKGDFSIEWWQCELGETGTHPIMTWVDGNAAVFVVRTVRDPANPRNKKQEPAARFGAGGVRSTATVHRGQWFHVVLVHRSAEGTLQWFINGQADKAGKWAGPEMKGAAELLVGQGLGQSAASFRGLIDELAIYDRALGAESVLGHFRAAVSSLPGREKIPTAGHRGNNRFAPENTLVSYVQAVELGVPIVEMDLHLSKDGKLVLMHDDTVKRTTGKVGNVSDFTAEELGKMDAGSWKDAKYRGEPVPRFERIAEACRGRAVIMLDLKATGLGKALAEWLAASSYPKNEIILAPWTDEEGRALRQYLPDVAMIRLSGKVPEEKFDDAYFGRMKEMGFGGFSIQWQDLPQAFVDGAHRNGMKVYTWTVNAPVEVSGAVLSGVDGIITDDPAATMKMVENIAGK